MIRGDVVTRGRVMPLKHKAVTLSASCDALLKHRFLLCYDARGLCTERKDAAVKDAEVKGPG